MPNWIAFTRVHCAIYRATRGLIGANLIGIQMLLLTTKGRKTGKSRTLPLAYVPVGDELVTADIDLDACREIQDNIFNFELHREPQHYGLIVERKGAGPKLEPGAGS